MQIAEIDKRIATACEHAGRSAKDITLIAVSKQQPDERIDAALSHGLRVFGENRVQEAQARWQQRRDQYPDLELHLIGHLQTNKAADAVALFDVIHTLDSVRLAQALSKEMKKQNRDLPCFIQVNTGNEEQKDGAAIEDLPTLLSSAQDLGITVVGLMCIPPVDEVPDLHFALLQTLAARHGLSGLSMGMSGDFDRAIIYGATHLRIGSALFGERS
jgi:hypothetical protein